jgi:hypothetical protein
VLTIREIRKLGSKLSADRFVREVGPFALIQRPETLQPGEGTQVMGEMPANARTTQVARPEKLTGDVLSMLFQFDDLLVATLPPLDGGGELSVGRAPDCDLVLDDGSVSKRHATLHWNEEKRLCTLEDLGSTNGTHLNGAIRIRKAVELRDGDIIGFGEMVFWYLLSPTLFDRIQKGSSGARPRAHSP